MTTGGTGDRIQTVETAFTIIKILERRGSIGVTTLSEELDVSTSTAFAYLNTLYELGYLIKENHQYRLGLGLFRHGAQIRHQIEVFRVAKSELDELAYQTNEKTGLGIEERGKRVYLYQAHSRNAISDNIPVGEYTHLHWTSLGKAILAGMADDRVEEIINTHGLPRATPNTITDRDVLFEELQTIRRRGYALEDEERRDGIRSVSMPIINSNKMVVGSIGIVGPKRRMSADRILKMIPLMEEKKNVIELKIRHY